MPPSSSKSPLSPTELAQLEHAFATDPASDAYRPLAEAYLTMGRFMEAMVVCKKGVKAHPDAAAPRVLLARVYADQGKDKKALEELQAALQVSPADVPALRLAGAVHFKLGDQNSGSEHLKKAIAGDPNDAETIELCKKHNVPLAAAAPPPPPPPAVSAPVAAVAAAAAAGGAVATARPAAVPAEGGPPRLHPVAQKVPTNGAKAAAAPATQPRRAPPAPPPPAPEEDEAPETTPVRPPRQAQRPAPAPRPVRQPSRPKMSYDDLAHRYGDAEEADRPQKSAAKGLIVAVSIILGGAITVAGMYIHAKAKDATNRQIAKILQVVQNELAHDSYAGYKKACEEGEKIVADLDPDLYSAHAYLAYAYAIRWGEHGEGELVERNAREHLKEAKAAGLEHSHIMSAEAYIRFFGGEAQQAVADLETAVEGENARGKRSPLILSTLGILQMHQGDLDKAIKYLKTAHDLAPADARISAALGNALRRQGNEFQAATNFEAALRYERDHAEAQLGVALMAIDSGKPDTAEKYVKRLLEADPPPSNRQLAMARMANAILLDRQNKTSDADREQAKALEMDARNPELYILKSRRLTAASKNDEAVTAVREAIKLDPKRASFYVDLAKVLISKPGGAKEAIESILQALKTLPGSPKLQILLGDAYKADGQFDKAREAYDKALVDSKGKLPEATMALADLARDKKDYPKALEMYEKAKNEYLSSTERQAYAMTEMGRIYEAQTDKQKALDFYKNAYNTDTSFAPAICQIARMFIFDGDGKKREMAANFFKEYLGLAPKGECAADAQKYAAK